MNNPFRCLIIVLIVACVAVNCRAQNHTNQWFFGYDVGINFNGAIPVANNSGQQSAFEGCSAYSDHNGNLLFYSDGLTVWNRNHVPMPNGTGLQGGLSSTTSALIVRHPGFCNRYFLFTVQDQFSTQHALRYSIIDMSLNGGLGDVMAGNKNILIANNCAEKITAIPHQNGTDQWIISHYLGSTGFIAYRLTPTGLTMTPVSSPVGAFNPSNCMIGFLKANHSGTRLVSVATFCSIVQMFDFNRTTGVVSNPVNLLSSMNGIYGIEFSPNDAILYLSKGFGNCALYQVNVATPATSYLVSSITGNYVYGGLQLGPDGKIYMARNGQNFLSVINNPNVWGPGCGFTGNGFTLAPGTSSGFGIISFPPEQVMNYLPGGYGISSADTCFGAQTQFAAMGVVEYDSIRWQFGDPATGPMNVDTGLTASHTFSASMGFAVTMIVYGCAPDTVTIPLAILPCVLPSGLDLFATTIGTDNYLDWQAESPDIAHFVVERLDELTGWQTIGFVPAAEGNAGAFHFVDRSVPTGIDLGYRVRLWTIGGETQFSNIAWLRHEPQPSAVGLIFPNPQQQGGVIQIQVEVSGPETMSYEVLDMMGRTVLQDRAFVQGPNALLTLDSAISLPPGHYHLRLISSSGMQMQHFIIE